MAITASITYTDEFTGSSATPSPNFLGSIGDKLTATINVSCVIQTLSVPLTFNGSTITRTDCITTSGIGSFLQDGYQAGDTIVIQGTGYYANDGTYTIATVTSTQIVITGTFASNGSFNNINVYDTTAVTGFDFYYNLVGNQDAMNFTSISDAPSIQKLNVNGLTTSSGSTSMSYLGSSKAWQDGATTIIGNGTSNYVQSFIIKHTFFIKPFYIADQLQALLNANTGNAITPDFFSGSDCLGYLYQIDARYSQNGAVVQSTGMLFEEGNTGWYNEFLNGNTPNYTLQSISYLDLTTNELVSTIDWNHQTKVTIEVTSVNGVFSGEEWPMLVRFMRLPNKVNEYSQNQNTYQQNFFIDTVLAKQGEASVNGDFYGTPYQAITNLTVRENSATMSTVVFTLNFGSSTISDFSNSSTNDCYYLIHVTPQAYSVSDLANTDRNAVICDVNLAATDTDDVTGLIFVDSQGDNNVLFANWPNYSLLYTNIDGWISDYWQAINQFKVKSGYNLLNYKVDINAVPAVYNYNSSFNLYTQSWVLQNYFNDTANEFSLSGQLGNNLFPAGDNRNTWTFGRNTNLDAAGYVGYELDFPIQLGYQYWVNLKQFDPLFINYNTQYWAYYFNSGYGLQFVVTANVLNPATGVITQYIHTANINVRDSSSYLSSYLTTTTSAGSDLADYVQGDGPTNITAFISGNNTIPAGFTGMYGIIRVYYDNGSEQVIDECNTEELPAEGSLFSGSAVLAVASGTQLTIEGNFNAEGINMNTVRIYANFGYK